MSETLDSIERTRQLLERYKQLGPLGRLSMRAFGDYPSSTDREELRRHELGPEGRIKENVFEALDNSRRVNKTPLALLSGRPWVTASLTGDSTLYTLPTPLDSKHLEIAKELFRVGGRKSTAERMDMMGFYVGGYNDWRKNREQAAEASVIGLAAGHDYNNIDVMTLSVNEMKALDPLLLKGLEEISAAVCSHANEQYSLTRPENVG